MAVTSRELRIGVIVEETLAVLERCKGPVAIYVVVLTLINGATAYFGLAYSAPLQELAKSGIGIVVGIVAAYQLLLAVLVRMGLRSPAARDDPFLPYVWMSILYTLGFMLGLVLLILPGLFVLARWSIAQPLLLVEQPKAVSALRDSWERTRGSEFPILVAMLALMAIFIAVAIFTNVVYEKGDPLGIALSTTASSVMSAISLSMSVALYKLIAAPEAAGTIPKVDPRQSA